VRRGLVLLGAALALAGCGSKDGGPPGPVLQQTAANLEKIETAVLHLSVRMKPKDGQEFGYEIDGPVQLAVEGELPLADVEYTQVANGQEDTVRLVLTEAGGWGERDGERTDLTEEQLAELRESGSLLGQDGLETLDFEQWIVDPERSDGPDGTEKITGEVDVATAMAGLAALSGVLAQDITLTAEQRKQVAEAVDDSSFELVTGEDDRLLRGLELDFTLDAEVPEDLREAIGEDVVGATFSFDLELDEVNEPVSIGD
jgi:hypothetical protein